MRAAIISSSTLISEGRWDARFHIALDQVKERVAQLKAEISAASAIEKLSLFPLEDKRPLEVLIRGHAKFDTRSVNAAVAEYPHLALAIMEKHLAPVIEKLKAEIASRELQIGALLDIQATTGKGKA